MSVIINGIDYGNLESIRVSIKPELLAVSSVKPRSNSNVIIRCAVSDVQHGMIFINDGKEEIVESIYITPEDPRTSFYHMHIYKTSGLSLKSNVGRSFVGLQSYNNFIGLYDEKQVLSSKFISGHFYRNPIDSFIRANKKLHAVTLIRNPIDRMISHCQYEMNMDSSNDFSIDKFIDFLNSDNKHIENLQSKNISSMMDTHISNSVAKKTIDGDMSISKNLSYLGETNRYIKPLTHCMHWQDYVSDFSIIGTIDKRDKFMGNLSDLLIKEGYTSNFGQEAFVNKSNLSSDEIKKKLPKDALDKIMQLNKYDFELYDYLRSKDL